MSAGPQRRRRLVVAAGAVLAIVVLWWLAQFPFDGSPDSGREVAVQEGEGTVGTFEVRAPHPHLDFSQVRFDTVGRISDASADFGGTIASVRLVPNNKMIVITSPDLRVSKYDLCRLDGPSEVEYGGRGDGPGEFRAVPAVASLPGDTLLFFDFEAARYTWFTDSGEVVRTLRFHREGLEGHFAGVLPGELVEVFSTGEVFHVGGLLSIASYERDSSGRLVMEQGVPVEKRMRVSVFHGSGREGVLLGEFPAEEGGWLAGTGGYFVQNPFFRSTLVAVWPEGGRLALGISGAPSITIYDSSGTARERFRIHAPMKPLTDDERDDFVRGELARAERVGVNMERAVRLLHEMAFPDSVLPYDNMLFDDQGRLWLRFDAGDCGVWAEYACQRYLILGGDGRLDGQLEIAAPGPITQVYGRVFMAQSEDELGHTAVTVLSVAEDRDGVFAQSRGVFDCDP